MSAPAAPRIYSVTLLDVATLLLHVHQGVHNPNVGFEDMEQTLEQLTSALSAKRLGIKQPVLESALWSSNLMDEAGSFKDPRGHTFDRFVRDLLDKAGYRESYFDKTYNQIKEKK